MVLSGVVNFSENYFIVYTNFKKIFIKFDHLWVKLFGFLQCILGV